MRIPLLISIASLQGAFLAHADLVAHYALDEAAGGSAVVEDSLGSNPGELIGSGTATKGFSAPHGTGYDLPLRSGFKIAPAPEVQPTDQFTISWWFRPTTLDQFDRLFETLAGTGNDGSGIRIDLGSSPGNKLRVLLRDGNGSSNTTVTNPLVLSTETWYFFAVRYDSLDGTCKVTVLADTGGNIAGSNISSATTTNSSLGTNALPHATGVFIAADDANAAGSNDFGGAMDDIAIFQTGDSFGVLTDAELAEVYNNGALAFDPPDPLPVINSFLANDDTVNSGEMVTLNWNVSDADSVELSPGFGSVAHPSGSVSFTASLTEVYTLTATNAEGSASQTLQVTVDGLALAPEISEFVASNSSFDDGDGNGSDWIEINNRNTTAFDLSGYFLTDDPLLPQKWAFPAGTSLAGSEYFVVFASGNDSPDSAGHLHTNFSLKSGGEYLALVAPNGSTIIQEFSPGYPEQKTDVSYTASGFLLQPTPRAENAGTPQQGFVLDTAFDIDRGHYTTPFDLTISTLTAGASIYYTIDGTEPTPSNGSLYSTPLNIATTTVLRAAAFKDNCIPTNVDTQSYIFLNDVINQPNNPPNTTTLWAGRIADYEMDQEIVTDPDYVNEIIPALEKFSTLSLTIDPDDFYGTQGLYQNPQSSGAAWERPVSAELIAHNGSESGFQIDAGLRIQGGSSRNPDTPKHSMSLRFRNAYGAGKLNYPLFRDAPDGRDAVEKFDTLQLRSGYNFGWTHRHFWQADKAQYARDQFVNDLFLEMDNTGVHGRWLHVYINGIYWGIYHLHERPDQDFMEAYFGGQDSDYDAINSNVATSGTAAAYNAMADVAEGNIASTAVYETMKTHLDIDSFIDYMLINFYVGNNDWDGHNWRAAGTGPTGVPFHFIPWDTEFAISPNRTSPAYLDIAGALNINRTGVNGNNRPTGIHQDLALNAEYRLRFADRAHHAFFNNGPLSPTGADATWRRRSDDMGLALVAESARWGDYRRDVQAAGGWQSSDFDLYTRDDHYYPIQDYILGTYLPQRPAIYLDQLRAKGLYPDVDAPTYSHTGSTLTMTNPNGGGTIFYTTDGSDPQDAGATTYSGAITLTLSDTYNSRVFQNGEWSALQSADVLTGIPARESNLVISEIYYNEPGAGESNEFIEFTNISNQEIDLSNLTFTAGLTYTFPVGTTLAAGAQLVLTAADYEGSLDNDGETLTLVDALGFIIESFAYNDAGSWPAAADGDGFSLVRISPPSQLDPSNPTSWRPSTALGGNPGTSDATTFPGGDEAALLIYALGANTLSLGEVTGSVIVPRNLAADDVISIVQTSTNLDSWTDLTEIQEETIPVNGVSSQTYQVAPAGEKRFFRLKVMLRN
ncbi:lamin tail domain-containing protein [Akkermansiaceae bacterium]|nr:lamin tail domain-containing protein [Akkermansiaceae bacterium]